MMKKPHRRIVQEMGSDILIREEEFPAARLEESAPPTKVPRAVGSAVEAVRLRIRSGHFRRGAALPAETVLATEFGISRGTIRRAIDLLISTGELSRRPHSRPIVSEETTKPSGPSSREVHVWVSRPLADGAVLGFLKGVSSGLLGTPYRMVAREPSRFVGQIVQSDERHFVEDLLHKSDFAAAILWRDPFAQNDDLIRRLKETGRPIIFVDTPPPLSLEGDYVGTANALAERACVEHLLGLGHSRIVFVADTDIPETTRDRIRGYWRAMRYAGLEEMGRVVIASELDPSISVEKRLGGPFARHTQLNGYFSDLAYRAMQAIAAMEPKPTAICVNHDVFALTLCAVLSGAGIRVPDDISVVGFDWFADYEKGFPDTLTSAGQSFERFGLHAANLFLDRASGEISPTPRHILLDAPLVIRSSTASDLSLPAHEPANVPRAELPSN